MSGAHTYTPLWPEVERLIAAYQPGGRMPRPNAEGWIGAVRSPIRDGDTNPSFSVLPDSEANPGAFKDHGTGEHGSMADLARLLGVKVGATGPRGRCRNRRRHRSHPPQHRSHPPRHWRSLLVSVGLTPNNCATRGVSATAGRWAVAL